MSFRLNQLASILIDQSIKEADHLKIELHTLESGGRVLDFGVQATGGIEAGIRLSEICMSGLGKISLTHGTIQNSPFPFVSVRTDHPVEACLLSQYAGWEIACDDFFAMGSGPMRTIAQTEPLFESFPYSESPERIVGVLEGDRIPDQSVFDYISEKTETPSSHIDLVIAPTASIAGNLQIISRSVETVIHKLHELEFDINLIQSATGIAPLAPVADNSLNGIGRTNDAILYGGTVHLMVTGDDEAIRSKGPQVPANSSPVYGKPFLEIFEDADKDFYKIDPHLFSPAVVSFQNISTGKVHTYGEISESVLITSFGLSRN